MIDALEVLAIVMGFIILLLVIGGGFLWGRISDLEHQLGFVENWLSMLEEDLEETDPDPLQE